jgi:hypothetical protein
MSPTARPHRFAVVLALLAPLFATALAARAQDVEETEEVVPVAVAEAQESVEAPGTPQPSQIDTSQAAVLAHLARTRQLFLESIAGLSAQQWRWKPARDRWSVAECAEHITRSESFIRHLAEQGLYDPLPDAEVAKGRGKAGMLLAAVIDRSQTFQAPEPLNPMRGGDVRSREQVVRDFTAERNRTVELASAIWDLEAYASPHPTLEVVDLAGWLYFLSGHTERHVLQIREVKATPGFPQR